MDGMEGQTKVGTNFYPSENRKPGGRRAPSALEPSGKQETTYYPQTADSANTSVKRGRGDQGGALGTSGVTGRTATAYTKTQGAAKKPGSGAHNASAGRVRGT
jgi:hypothetical protein